MKFLIHLFLCLSTIYLSACAKENFGESFKLQKPKYFIRGIIKNGSPLNLKIDRLYTLGDEVSKIESQFLQYHSLPFEGKAIVTIKDENGKSESVKYNHDSLRHCHTINGVPGKKYFIAVIINDTIFRDTCIIPDELKVISVDTIFQDGFIHDFLYELRLTDNHITNKSYYGLYATGIHSSNLHPIESSSNDIYLTLRKVYETHNIFLTGTPEFNQSIILKYSTFTPLNILYKKDAEYLNFIIDEDADILNPFKVQSSYFKLKSNQNAIGKIVASYEHIIR